MKFDGRLSDLNFDKISLIFYYWLGSLEVLLISNDFIINNHPNMDTIAIFYKNVIFCTGSVIYCNKMIYKDGFD